MYVAFIRPLFEYACVVWYSAPRHEKYFNEMEKLQLQGARIVTGTNNYASKQLLYNETEWSTLASRREKQRLILMYKIINGLAPSHLSSIFSNYVNDQQRYELRTKNIQLLFSRTETYRSSFFPSAIRLWNSLDPSARSAETLSEFKSKLSKKKRLKNTYYDRGSRKINTTLASMRMGCSQLNGDLSKNNIIVNTPCICGEVETAFHFFFVCPQYIIQRDKLLTDTVFVQHLSLTIILNGDANLSIQQDTELHQAVSNYVLSTNRF